MSLLTNVHEGFEVRKTSENINKGKYYLIKGCYDYYHYLCDGLDDRGWGCGYRTLQTMCSWIIKNTEKNTHNVPSITEIQEVLVDIKDKPPSFVGTKQWIGSFEICLVIDKLYDIPCKISHVNKEENLQSVVETLKKHFDNFGSPAMDCSSKGIMGIHIGDTQTHLLVVDPHYVGKEQSKSFLQNKGWVKWQLLEDFISNSFYNICMPLVKPMA